MDSLYPQSASQRLSAAKQAIENSWDAWLAEHCVTVPQFIQQAVKSAFRDWLDQNHESVLRAIGDAVAKSRREDINS
jgi:hypothetical protein